MTFSLPVIARNLNCKGNWGIVDKIGSTYNRSCPDEKLIKQIYRQEARVKKFSAILHFFTQFGFIVFTYLMK
jgi:hypothetical protein